MNMKSGFENIFGAKEKRGGAAVLLAAALAAGVSASFAACDAAPNRDSGSASVAVPASPSPRGAVAGQSAGFASESGGGLIGGAGTAMGQIAELAPPSPRGAFAERDSGNAGIAYPAPSGPYGAFEEQRSGFVSESGGWFIGSTGVAMGHQENYVYLTHDGGKTWQETGNVNDEWPRVLTCGGFADDKAGFLCFRYDIENIGRIYHTADGGKTWEILDIPPLSGLVGEGVGEARQIEFAGETVSMSYFVREAGADDGELYSLTGAVGGDWSVSAE
ncbi:MAG: hypothetical protein LBL83_02260 [Clostridiales bacterium]|jgi:hypothetical protein|nr:hypothetical protein [Clostridiales bacterium]